MTYKVAETRFDTWIVYNTDDGVVYNEFENEWEARDWSKQLNLLDEQWDNVIPEDIEYD